MTIIIKSASIRNRIDRVCSSLLQEGVLRLQRFRNKCLIQNGLVPSSFDYPFTWASNNSSELTQFRKSLGKLRMILLKHINKIMPYTLFSTVPVLDIFNKECLSMTLQVPGFELDLSKIPVRELINANISSRPINVQDVLGSTRAKIFITNKIREEILGHKSLDRYVRYLNYLCRKYGLAVKTIYAHNPIDLGSSGAYKNNLASHVLQVPGFSSVVIFSFKCWVPPDLLEEKRVRSEGLVDDFIYTDAHAATRGGWSDISAGSSRSGFHVNSTPDALFAFLPQITKVITTLTRKVHYDIGAYTFRTN